jgi:GNAT superfamily N-acetyltransferase
MFAELTLSPLEFERKLLSWDLWYESTFLDRAADPVRFKEYIKLAPWDFFKEVSSRWHLAIIGVSPQHQRRGIGRILVERGQKLAAEEGLPLTLESSIPGRALYAKMGFKMVGAVQIYDGFSDGLMLWEPEEMKGKWVEDTENGEAKLKVLDGLKNSAKS